VKGRVVVYRGGHVQQRPEHERQQLIAEYRRLRAAGLNVDRQDRLLVELGEFELGWPKPMRSGWR